MFAIFPQFVELAAQKKHVEALASAFRQHVQVVDIEPHEFPIDSALKNFGIEVHEQPLTECGAIVIKDRQQEFQPYLLLPSTQYRLGRRFLLAHLLGHLFFDIQPLISQGKNFPRGIKEHESPLSRYLKNPPKQAASETLCDEFAAELLVPARMIHKTLSPAETLQLASQFGVSAAFLFRRNGQPAQPAAPHKDKPSSRADAASKKEFSDVLSKIRNIAKKIEPSVK